MDELKTLIDKAAKRVHSEANLARALGIPQTHITNWKAGTRTCVPADRARLAGLAGEDAAQELIRATIEQSTGTRRDQLEKLLGNIWRQTGAVGGSAVLGLFSLTSGLTAILASSDSYFIRCIERLTGKRSSAAASYV